MCEARTYGQDKTCHRCGLTWSIDDEKPACLSQHDANGLVIKRLRESLQSGVKGVNVWNG